VERVVADAEVLAAVKTWVRYRVFSRPDISLHHTRR
jgi:hypothetical protein